MALTFVASSAGVGNGTTGTAAVSATPTLPTGTVSGDRVFIGTTSVGQVSAPAGWTELVNTLTGGGTMGAGTGQRYAGIFYRDYDGAWTMPTVTAASTAANTIVACAVSYTKAAGESFSTPTATVGNDTTADTSLSATSSTSQTLATGSLLWVYLAIPAAIGTQSATSLSAQNATTTVNNSAAPAAFVNTTGNDAGLQGRVYNVTSGGTGTQTYSATVVTARTAGVVFVSQAIGTAASAPIPPQVTVSNPATTRAAYW